MRPSRLAFLALATIALILAGTARNRAADTAASSAPQKIDAATCGACHDERVASFAHNPHSALDTKGLAGKGGAAFSCAACHGDGSKHVEAAGGKGTIFAFGDQELASVKTERCLKCHADVHPAYRLGPHGKAGMSCTDCHSVHAGDVDERSLLKPAAAGRLIVQKRGVSALCAECHGDIANRFQLTEHHRLQEGIIECTSCHDPHVPQTRTALGGFKQEACSTCHADKNGPFVYEHASIRVEGCVACHDPHGSVNRHQLEFQQEGALCLSCHTEVPSFHSRFGVQTNCTNCHTSIHGSNVDPFFLQ